MQTPIVDPGQEYNHLAKTYGAKPDSRMTNG
jgi:hypothetical protein